jgi:hypothetical protein
VAHSVCKTSHLEEHGLISRRQCVVLVAADYVVAATFESWP